MTESDRLQQQLESGTLTENESCEVLQRLIDVERERRGIAMNLPSIPEYVRKEDGFIRVYTFFTWSERLSIPRVELKKP
jgi:hypothetical protein